MIKLRSSLLVLVGIVGLVLYFSVRGLLTYSKNRTVEARSPSKVVIQKLDSPTNGNDGGRQWRASMGDIAASGVVVNCTEYANGQLSNVFILSDGIIITQSIVWPLSPSLLGTKEYETKARYAFESRVAIEPALLEFLNPVLTLTNFAIDNVGFFIVQYLVFHRLLGGFILFLFLCSIIPTVFFCFFHFFNRVQRVVLLIDGFYWAHHT